MASQVDPVIQHPAVLQRAAQPEQASLAALLQYEGDIRRQASVNELVYFIANETRRIVAYDQMFVLRQAALGKGYNVVGASSLAVIDRSAPLIHAIEKAVTGSDAPLDLIATEVSDDPSIADYPFPAWRWQPLTDGAGLVYAGLLLTRHEPMREAEGVRLDRISETISHSWQALTGGRPVRRLPLLGTWSKRALALALVVGAVFPVRITALAPVEVVPARPFVVSAPYPGVIARIDVAPNAMVAAGQPVLTFEDIKVRNDLQQALQKVQVARARIDRATSAAFGKAEEARDIATMKAEYDVALAEYNYARDLMGKAQVVAPVSGMALYSDRRDWEGRAVNTGDPIVQIADPKAVSYRIDLPAKEQMTLEDKGDVTIWLDAQPLTALEGTIEQASYLARPTAEGVLAFAVAAKPKGTPPRIGSRGTAKLYGERVPFIYALFKRPIASLRQFLGV
jgi:HlyD family secretion protein